MNNKKLKVKMGSKISEGMLMPYNKMLDDVKKEINKMILVQHKLISQTNTLSVIIAKSPCVLLKGNNFPYKCEVDNELCKKCGMCLKIGCPVLNKKDDGSLVIDKSMCNGCGLCRQQCKFNAIKKVEK